MSHPNCVLPSCLWVIFCLSMRLKLIYIGTYSRSRRYPESVNDVLYIEYLLDYIMLWYTHLLPTVYTQRHGGTVYYSNRTQNVFINTDVLSIEWLVDFNIYISGNPLHNKLIWTGLEQRMTKFRTTINRRWASCDMQHATFPRVGEERSQTTCMHASTNTAQRIQIQTKDKAS